MEYNNYIEANSTSVNNTHINILEYNIDRNGYGESYEKGHIYLINKIIDLKYKHGINVISLIEVARNCEEYGAYVNFADNLARKLKWNYVYSVEFINSQADESRQCTIGNVILSEFVLSNYGFKFFDHQCCMYSHFGGGRSFLYADIVLENTGLQDVSRNEKEVNQVLNTSTYRVATTHLESGTFDIQNIVGSFIIRNKQLNEIVSFLYNNSNKKVINDSSNSQITDYFIIGDMNSPFMKLDYSLLPVFLWYDAFSSTAFWKRQTCPFGYQIISNLDYIFAKNKGFEKSEVCNTEDCTGLSDHDPIIASYKR